MRLFGTIEHMQAQDLSFTDIEKIVQFLRAGKIGIMPTDTIYGIMGSALNPNTVEEIYLLRKRGTDKPLIVLISSLDDLNYFDILLSEEQKNFLEHNWPNPLSVVISCPSERFKYLHRGKNSIAFRMPKDDKLLKVLKEAGPLVAPSANLAGELPAEDINQAKRDFDNQVSFYADGGKLISQPSTIIQLFEDGSKIILREGEIKVS